MSQEQKLKHIRIVLTITGIMAHYIGLFAVSILLPFIYLLVFNSMSFLFPSSSPVIGDKASSFFLGLFFLLFFLLPILLLVLYSISYTLWGMRNKIKRFRFYLPGILNIIGVSIWFLEWFFLEDFWPFLATLILNHTIFYVLFCSIHNIFFFIAILVLQTTTLPPKPRGRTPHS